jgi:hypothetical protein
MIGLIVSLTVGGFSLYPRPLSPEPRIEAIIQRGAIFELIVKCETGSAIISFAPADGMYCSPSFKCSRDRAETIAASCGGTSSLK